MNGQALPEATAFLPAWGLGNPHAQTIWPYYLRRSAPPSVVREVWDLPDGDVLDVVRLPEREGRPLVVVLHGLEASADAPYVRGMLARVAERGWNGVAISMPTCGPSPSRQGRLYHSGKTDEVDAVMERLAARWGGVPRGAVGFSMGGNMLLKWLGERGDGAPLTAAVVVSVPFELGLCAGQLDRPGVFSFLYRERFLRSLRRKARRLSRLQRAPFLLADVAAARTFALFDELITSRLFGFEGAEDYWRRSSSAGFLSRVERPTLAIAAEDDPFVPLEAVPREAFARNPHLTLWLAKQGGHVGFMGGSWRRPRMVAEEAAMLFLRRHLGD